MGKILNIVIVILILAALVYGYMQFTASSEPVTPEGLSTASGIDAVSPDGLTLTTQQGDFVTLLLELKQISLDTTFLASTVFTSLQDFSRDIAPQAVGRRNPFGPIGRSAGAPAPRTTSAVAPATQQSILAPVTPPPGVDIIPPVSDETPPSDPDQIPPPDQFEEGL